MNAVLDTLPADERKLLEVVREIKRSGFGEFHGTITSKEIVTIREAYTHKLS